MAPQIIGVPIVCPTVCSATHQGKHQKLRVTHLCEGNLLVTGGVHLQRASNAKKYFHLMTSSLTNDQSTIWSGNAIYKMKSWYYYKEFAHIASRFLLPGSGIRKRWRMLHLTKDNLPRPQAWNEVNILKYFIIAVTGGFPLQRASNTEKFSIWWRH